MSNQKGFAGGIMATYANHSATDDYTWDVFLTHDWANDQLGRSNHARVARIAAELNALGIKVWFDEDQMRGDINKKMAEGIDGSVCVLVFVTARYVLKATGKGARGDDDNW